MKKLGKHTRGHIVNEETDDQNALEDAKLNLESARESLQEAYEYVEAALDPIKGQPATSIKAYFLDKLKIMISEEHGFMTNDPTIDSIIEDMEDYWGQDPEDREDESTNETAEEKPSFEPGEKVKNVYNELLTVVCKAEDGIQVEEQPNRLYDPKDLTKFVDKEAAELALDVNEDEGDPHQVDPVERKNLEDKHGQVWNTTQLQQDFSVTGFQAPYVVVKRKKDGLVGSLEFQHAPRYYFGWKEN